MLSYSVKKVFEIISSLLVSTKSLHLILQVFTKIYYKNLYNYILTFYDLSSIASPPYGDKNKL